MEGLYYLHVCSKNKGADQLRGYREADLRLFFAYAKCWFSHDAAQISVWDVRPCKIKTYLNFSQIFRY